MRSRNRTPQVGGSLAGLFCGVVLKRLGHNLSIFERNPTPLLHNQGAGIVAGGDVQDFLKRYDSIQRRIGVESRVRQHLDRQGNILRRENYSQNMTSWDLLYHILRANFDGNDCGYIEVPSRISGEGEAVYQYGSKVTDLREKGKTLEVEYTDATGAERTHTADLVIAADGAGSRVRDILTPKATRTYAGYVAFRGTVEEKMAQQ